MTSSGQKDFTTTDALIQETKSSPSLKQTFLYFARQDTITVESPDERKRQPLSSVWDYAWDFVYVSNFRRIQLFAA